MINGIMPGFICLLDIYSHRIFHVSAGFSRRIWMKWNTNTEEKDDKSNNGMNYHSFRHLERKDFPRFLGDF